MTLPQQSRREDGKNQIMKLTIKQVSKATDGSNVFELDNLETSMTILQVKEKCTEVKKQFIAANMKLIASGRILSNDKTVGDCGLKDGDFLASLDPFISGFRVFLGSDLKGSSEIDRGFRVWAATRTCSRFPR